MLTIEKTSTTLFVIPTEGITIAEADLKVIEEIIDLVGAAVPIGASSLDDLLKTLNRLNRQDILSDLIAELSAIKNQYQLDANLPYQRHSANTAGRDFVVGDIHGQLEAFEAALRRVDFDKTVDRCFSVGDLIDRGADSLACLELVFENYFHAVRGNHECMALHATSKEAGPDAYDHWLQNGGDWSLGENAMEVAILLREAGRYLPLARDITLPDGTRVGICHAEPPRDWDWVQFSPLAHVERLTWGRSRFSGKGDTRDVKNIDAVVVGHTIKDDVTWQGNVVDIDTGAFTPNGQLTLIELSTLLATKPT